jgi:uncharacterized protein (DUF58 family)
MTTRELNASSIDLAFEIAVRRLADDLRYGSDVARFAGSGVDYLQSRRFVQGDPLKSVDWRVTARTGHVHVKEYEALKGVPIYLVVDTSASMAVSSTSLSKHTLAAMLAGGLALAGLSRLSPVGLMAGGERDLHFQPGLARGRVFQWLHALRHQHFDESTVLSERLSRLEALLHSTSLVVVLSDLHDPFAVPTIKRIAQRHDCMVLQLQDPAERGVPGGGLFRAGEAETGRAFFSRGLRRPYVDSTSPRLALQRAAVDCLLLSTDQPFVAPLRRFLNERGGLLRNQR